MKLILFSPPEDMPNEQTLLRRCFERGLTHFHLRKPAATQEELFDYLSKVPELYHKHIVLHNHYSLLEKFQLKGIHLPEKARQELSIKKAVSTSFHHLVDLRQNRLLCEYVFLSPIFDSISKVGYKAAFAEKDLQKAVKASAQSVIALGGIQASNIALVADWGFAGCGVLGAVWGSKDVVGAFEKIKAQV